MFIAEKEPNERTSQKNGFTQHATHFRLPNTNIAIDREIVQHHMMQKLHDIESSNFTSNLNVPLVISAKLLSMDLMLLSVYEITRHRRYSIKSVC